MIETYLTTQSLPDFALWQKKRDKNSLVSFTLELTARCNNNCRHCYINLPEDDQQTKVEELSFEEISSIVDQAVDLGAVWCLITGGEPLLRDDFEEIYLYLKRKGLLVTVFTNGTLITQKHVDLFKKYPPRDLEVTVYGITQKTYAAVTREPGLFHAFMNGVNLLLKNDIRVNLKNVTIKANLNEFQDIAAFCRKHSHASFRFDPLIHLRFDRDETRNSEIRKQRLSPKEIADLERSDEARRQAMAKNCEKLILPLIPETANPYIFGCGAGISDFVVSYNGFYRICSSLWHTDCMCDLRKKTIKDAREKLMPKVRATKSDNPEFIKNCATCALINLCIWCPAHSFLESGHMDTPCRYFCEVAEKRSLNMKEMT
jgi:radical SAM protein with 4Fe4S-binding SPASM domain